MFLCSKTYYLAEAVCFDSISESNCVKRKNGFGINARNTQLFSTRQTRILICFIAFNKIITSGAFTIRHSSGKCKHIFIIAVCQFSSDHTSTLYSCFDDDRSVTHSRDYAVSRRKIVFIRCGVASEFCQQTSIMFYHIFCQARMLRRINLVQPVCQHTYR